MPQGPLTLDGQPLCTYCLSRDRVHPVALRRGTVRITQQLCISCRIACVGQGWEVQLPPLALS